MIDCQNLEFSPSLAQDRLRRAERTFGRGVLRRLICFVLYLLGVNRRLIAHTLSMPSESAKPIIKAIEKGGLAALEDRRRRTSSFLPSPEPTPPQVKLHEQAQCLIVDFGHAEKSLKIPRDNPLQIKVVLLSLLKSGLVPQKQVAEWLGLTRVHVHNLAHKLDRQDVDGLLDKRRGQTQDYRIPVDVKAELIQQFVLDVASEGRLSGQRLADHLQERCQLSLAPRTIRYHLDKLGLSRIRDSLPELLSSVKKTPIRPPNAEPRSGDGLAGV